MKDYTVQITMKTGEIVDEVIYQVYDSPDNQLAIMTAQNLVKYGYPEAEYFELFPR